jgi:hypothetical protein
VAERQGARVLASRGPFALIIDATGALTIDGVGPEKRLRDLDVARLSRAFLVNAIGPALLLDALDATPASGEAVFIDYRGQSIEW